MLMFLLNSAVFAERIALATFLYNTFEFNESLDQNVQRVWEACSSELKKKGFDVVPYEEIMAVFKSQKIGEYKLSTREVEILGRELGVDRIVTGRISKYLGYKGFSVTDFFTTEGEIVIEARMYTISKQSWNWENNVTARKKYRMSGIFKKKGLVLRSILKEAVQKLFASFENRSQGVSPDPVR